MKGGEGRINPWTVRSAFGIVRRTNTGKNNAPSRPHTRAGSTRKYLAAHVPTSSLTQALAGTIARVIANDLSSDVTVQIGSTILMRRSPIPTR